MLDIFLLSLVLGGLALVAQIVLGMFAGTDIESVGDPGGADDALDMLSVRSISAGAALFGATGVWLSSRALPVPITVGAAAVAGVLGMVGTAYLTRQIMRLESDGSLRLENAVGQAGTVYLPVPPQRQGLGRVQFMLQGRTVELRAVADEAVAIPTGTAVIVVGVLDDDTVEVMPTPQIEGM
jgi:hypothetical protein